MPAIFDDEDLSFPVPYVNGRPPVVSSPHGHHDAPSRPASVQPDLTLSDARAAQRLGQYTIIKSLGEGSFGKVKLAVHSATGQRVALKVISRRKLHNRDMVGRVDREIKYLQLLRHPHIIKLCVSLPSFALFFLLLPFSVPWCS
jgi:carbon catabolite-derepressing protein kinase